MSIEAVNQVGIAPVRHPHTFSMYPQYASKEYIELTRQAFIAKIVVFFVRGSDELEDTKAQNSVDALELIDATLDEIKVVVS